MGLYTMVPGNNQSKSMRNLIVNDIEKYRLEINNTLVYAKGKINFNYNNTFTDSNNISHSILETSTIDWLPKSVFAFYNDGFYEKGQNNNFYKYVQESLNDITIGKTNSAFYKPIEFLGWYLSPSSTTKGTINSIEEVYSKTDLFKYKNNNSLPEITLYAHWKIPEVTLKVYNIEKQTAKSSAIRSNVEGKQNGTTSDIEIGSFKIIYETDVARFIGTKITGLKYISWASNKLDGTSNQNALRAGPQGFLGWMIMNAKKTDIPIGYMSLNTYYWPKGFSYTDFEEAFDFSWKGQTYKTAIKTIHAVPCFKALAVWPKFKIKSNNKNYNVGNKFKTYSTYSEVHLGSIYGNDSPSLYPGWSWGIQKADRGSIGTEIKYIPIGKWTGNNGTIDLNAIRLCYSSTIVFEVKSI